MSIKLKFKIQSWHRTKKSLFKLSILLTGDHTLNEGELESLEHVLGLEF